MNVEIGGEAVQFPEKEYINGIALAVYELWSKMYTQISNPFWTLRRITVLPFKGLWNLDPLNLL
jgi:hypothetical protein